MKAVFVDGVGRTKEIDVDQAHPTYKWPVPLERRINYTRAVRRRTSENCEYAVALFYWLGRLHDGRFVYGQAEANFRLWQYDMATTEEEVLALRAHSDDVFAMMLNTFLKRETIGKVVILHEHTTREKQIIRRRAEGVAKQVERDRPTAKS